MNAVNEKPWWAYGLWILTAGALGLAVSTLFSSVLHWSRNGFLVPYTVIVCAFLYLYIQWSGMSIREHMHHRWIWGLIGAVIMSMIMVMVALPQLLVTPPL